MAYESKTRFARFRRARRKMLNLATVFNDVVNWRTFSTSGRVLSRLQSAKTTRDLRMLDFIQMLL